MSKETLLNESFAEIFKTKLDNLTLISPEKIKKPVKLIGLIIIATKLALYITLEIDNAGNENICEIGVLRFTNEELTRKQKRQLFAEAASFLTIKLKTKMPRAAVDVLICYLAEELLDLEDKIREDLGFLERTEQRMILTLFRLMDLTDYDLLIAKKEED